MNKVAAAFLSDNATFLQHKEREHHVAFPFQALYHGMLFLLPVFADIDPALAVSHFK